MNMSGTSQLAKNLRRFSLITFDVTDTLLKFRVPPATQYKETACKYGFNINEKEIKTFFNNEFKNMFKCYPNFGKGSDIDWRDWWKKLIYNIFLSTDNIIPPKDLEQIANELIHIYRTEEGNCWIKVEGADNLINKIRNLNKKIGIISNFDPSLHDVIRFMKLPKFDFILTSYEVDSMKPNEKIFKKAMELSDSWSKSHKSLHIGNSLELDYLGALNVGWSSILISDPNEISIPIENKEIINKKHIFNSLEHALHILENTEIKW